MLKDLLLEIGTEEIPAKFMPGALAQLRDLAAETLAAKRLEYREIQTFGTPRRLVLLVKELADRQQDLRREVKGPAKSAAFGPDGQPTKAALGFARSQGVQVESLIVKPWEGGEYVFAVVEEAGRVTESLLPEMLPAVITGLSFPKAMRWGNEDMRFARPIRWLLALYGGTTVDFTLAGVRTGKYTYGHRFLSKGPLAVNSPADYFNVLDSAYVVVNPKDRERMIAAQIEALAREQGGKALIDPDLLAEVVFLVEYPTALCGRFEDKYLELPDAALITPMREHQRYFPVVDETGKLLPVFITVRNGTGEYMDIVRAGNEKVLRARLADAKFFYDEDRREKLADRVEKLKTVVFQENLGSMYDKTERLRKLSRYIAEKLAKQGQGIRFDVIDRAAYLAKADLVTNMVREFTELQGVMGREYAKNDGEPPEVAQAIYEHYLPRFAGDALPETCGGRILAIADKLDNIVASFSRGIIPTGSQDPYALRRQATGIVNIMIDGGYSLSLKELSAAAMDYLGIRDEGARTRLTLAAEEFFQLRLKTLLSDQGVRYDCIDAVVAAGADDVYDTYLRAQALTGALGSGAFTAVVTAFTRVQNLAKKGESMEVDTRLFTDPAERALFDVYREVAAEMERLVEKRDYTRVLTMLARLQAPVDAFFTAVMVMAEDPAMRNNRLALLLNIAALMRRVADLSKVVV